MELLWDLDLGHWNLEFLWCFEFGSWSFHSYRNASIGSTRAARRAGNQHASKATAIRSNEIAINVAGSVGLMPKSRPLNKRVRAKAPASPMATPIPANLSPWRST